MRYSLDKLRGYVMAKLPVLDKAIHRLQRDQVRIVLNAALDMEIASTAPVSDSVDQYIDALQKADAEGRLYLDVLPKALAAIKNLR